MAHYRPQRLLNTVVASGLLAFACSAIGQVSTQVDNFSLVRSSAGTLKVEGSTISADGVLQHCGLVFTALLRDTNAKSESYVTLNGSFNLSVSPGVGVNYLLKLGVRDFPGDLKQPGVRPANAFVRAPNGKVPTRAVRGDGEPGYALFVGRMEGAALDVLRGIIESNVLEVGFNREAGGRDVTIVLDLTVVDTQFVGTQVRRKHSEAAVDEFTRCITRLAEDGVASLRK